MWHASVAGGSDADILELHAELELFEVGDASLGEWRHWSGHAFHIRRRLTSDEEKLVGPVVDVRRTSEARRRLAVVSRYLPLGYREA